MTKIISFFSRFFFNTWYKIRPPEMVSYWKRNQPAKAKLVRREDGSEWMEIEGEKRLYPGFPRGHFLTGPLAAIKHKIKNALFNEIFAEMEKVKYDLPPKEKMVPAVRHMYETFEKLEECEVVPDMKDRIKLIKKVMCAFLSEDDAYRLRAQMFLDMIDQKKVRLSKEDRYYGRGKYLRIDRYAKIPGLGVVDKFTY